MTPDRIEPASLSTHQHLAFLRQLSTDDALRGAFAADPVTTLRQLGIEIDANELPNEIVLPSKEAFAEMTLSAFPWVSGPLVPWQSGVAGPSHGVVN